MTAALAVQHLDRLDVFSWSGEAWVCTAPAHTANTNPELIIVPATLLGAQNRRPQQLVFRRWDTVDVGDLS